MNNERQYPVDGRHTCSHILILDNLQQLLSCIIVLVYLPAYIELIWVATEMGYRTLSTFFLME